MKVIHKLYFFAFIYIVVLFGFVIYGALLYRADFVSCEPYFDSFLSEVPAYCLNILIRR